MRAEDPAIRFDVIFSQIITLDLLVIILRPIVIFSPTFGNFAFTNACWTFITILSPCPIAMVTVNQLVLFKTFETIIILDFPISETDWARVIKES